MASLKKHPSKSPFWFLKYKGPDDVWRDKSLRPLRHGVAADYRKAKAIEAEHSLEENRRSPKRDIWASWVPDYLATRYGKDAASAKRSANAWAHLSRYFAETNIRSPQELNYRQCMDYMPWRKKATGAAHNTALLELKYLNVICQEAVRRDMISSNPASKLGIGKERGKEKPELTDEHIASIRAELRKEAAWMSHAFEMAIHQGCRISETPVFTADVNLEKKVIHFRKTKGDKPFTAPIHPGLLPLLTKLVGQRAERIFELPVDAPRQWHRFFQGLIHRGQDAEGEDLPPLVPAGTTFHSTRVTVASRMARGNVSIVKAMRLLNHSSELVHRSYQRLQAADVADVFDSLNIPGARTDSRSPGTPDDLPATS